MILMAWLLLTVGYDHKVTATDYPTEAACHDAAWSVDRGNWLYWVCR